MFPSSTRNSGQISTMRNITIRAIGMKRFTSRSSGCSMFWLSWVYPNRTWQSPVLLVIPSSSIMPKNRFASHRLEMALMNLEIDQMSVAIFNFFSLCLNSSLFGTPLNLHFKYKMEIRTEQGITKLIIAKWSTSPCAYIISSKNIIVKTNWDVNNMMLTIIILHFPLSLLNIFMRDAYPS